MELIEVKSLIWAQKGKLYINSVANHPSLVAKEKVLF
jgi:hypothetical protein